jgi:hypothetical protein
MEIGMELSGPPLVGTTEFGRRKPPVDAED